MDDESYSIMCDDMMIAEYLAAEYLPRTVLHRRSGQYRMVLILVKAGGSNGSKIYLKWKILVGVQSGCQARGIVCQGRYIRTAAGNTFPGFMMFKGSKTAFIPRIISSSSAVREK